MPFYIRHVYVLGPNPIELIGPFLNKELAISHRSEWGPLGSEIIFDSFGLPTSKAISPTEHVESMQRRT